ncbi:hypothetical protein F4810DRAFT_671191 [Camillea tinctor]|nr:hypothetical protein F4810DRAFT_671191 [Camillea tinctor]
MPKFTLSEFLEYLRAFNARDYEKQHSFYAEGVELALPDPRVPVLKGSPAVKNHYNSIHADADEFVVPIVVLIDRGRVFLQMHAYFRYKNKAKGVHGLDVNPGDVVKIDCGGLYDLDQNNKMSKITCYLFGEEFLGQQDVKEKIRESESRADPDLRIHNF